jgi:PAS domain S-box-containing protein
VHSEIGQETALELFESAPCGYLFTRPDGTITKVNQTFLRWTGYTGEQLIGRKRFQDLLTVPAGIFYETHYSPLLSLQGFVREIALDIVCANGKTLPALINSATESDTRGLPVLTRTTVFDVSERRRYEHELLLERRKAEHLASVVEDASDAIVTTAPDLLVRTWNRGAQEMFNYTATEAVGRDIRDLIVPTEAVKDFDEQVAKARSGESVHYESRRRNKTGELVEVSVTVTPQIDPPDEFLGFSAIMRDIRARKQREAAHQTRRDLELANRLAHEINNPLQAIVNCLAMISSGGDSHYIQIAEEHLARVAQVVRDLVKLTRQ